MKLKNYLILAFIIFAIKNDDEDVAPVLCNTDIVESYNLDSYIEPREVEMYLCPKISYSCCSTYDQFSMRKTWQTKIRSKMNQYHESINKIIKNLRTKLIEFFKINLSKLITDKQIAEKQKNKMQEVYLFIKEKNLPKWLEKLAILQIGNAKFMKQNRSAFYCNICEFSNQEYVNVKEKSLKLALGSCRKIADGTIPFSSMLTIEIIPQLLRLSKIIKELSLTPKATDIRLFNFVNIHKDVGRCLNVVKKKSFNSKPCSEYCSHFKFNAHSPVIEGNSEFMGSFLTQLTKFITDFKRRRVLESENDANDFEFTRNDIEHIEDPYTERKMNPKFDDYMIGHMYNFQKKYDKEKQIAYLNFMKNKLHYIDIAYNFENGDNEPIIKTKNHIVVDFENYETIVDQNGMDVTKNMVNNLECSMKDLVGHIKRTSRYKIKFEKLDPGMVDQVNEIDDNYVSLFHQDNFVDFHDFSKTLKKEEILNNYDRVKEESNSTGYSIKV